MTDLFPGLEGSVSIVSGAGSSTDPIDQEYPGTGVAISVALARSGSQVAVFDRDGEAAARTSDFITSEGGDSLPIVCDVTDAGQVREAVGAVVARYGSINCLVNNVGIMAATKAVVEVPDEEWNRIFQANVRGAVYAVRYAADAMTAGGSIVNVSSTTASRPHRNRGVYPITKGALNSLTTSLAVDLGPQGIRVNAVAPGSIWTPLGRQVLLAQGGEPDEIRKRRALDTTLLRKVGTAWHIADAVCFLCSAASSWITGQILTVDGGGSVLWGTRNLHVDGAAG